MANKDTQPFPSFPWLPVCDGTTVLGVPGGCIVAVEGAGVCFVPRTPAEAVTANAAQAIAQRNAEAKAEADAKAKAKAKKPNQA